MTTCFHQEGLFDRLVFRRPSAIAALVGPAPSLYNREESNR